MGEATNSRGFLTGGWRRVRRRAEFWQGWYLELQKGKRKKQEVF